MEITLHDKQERAIYSPKRVRMMISGIQSGKTLGGGIATRSAISHDTEEDSNFIVTAPTSKIMRQATLPTFLKMHQGLGRLNKSDMEFVMPKNRTVYLRTFSGGKEPNAIEGITNVKFIWADEAGMLNRKCWDNIEGRSAFKRCPIFVSTTPYALNFLYKDIFKPWQKGLRPDIDIYQFPSIENPYFPEEEYERQRELLDPRVFAMKYDGTFQKMSGLVYMDFDENNFIPPFNIRKHIDAGEYFVCAGVDWGYANQYAIAVRAIHKYDKNRDYQIDELYLTRTTPTEKVAEAKKLRDKWKIEIFYCDCAEPDMIAEFNKSGLHATGVPKSREIMLDGIHHHQGLIKQNIYKVFSSCCPYTEEEYELYHYDEDLEDEKNLSEVPFDSNNHLMDANRYVTQETKELRRGVVKKNQFKITMSETEKLVKGIGKYRVKQNQGWYE